MLAFKDGPWVRLVSFRELAAAVAALKAPTLILDGEVCVFARASSASFICSTAAPSTSPARRPSSWPCDCLHVHGLDVRGLPLHRRRDMLEQEGAGASMMFAARRLPNNGLTAWATRSWVNVKIAGMVDSCSAAFSAARYLRRHPGRAACRVLRAWLCRSGEGRG